MLSLIYHLSFLTTPIIIKANQVIKAAKDNIVRMPPIEEAWKELP
jgi:hypothetical protein